jgi:hypothetical protein
LRGYIFHSFNATGTGTRTVVVKSVSEQLIVQRRDRVAVGFTVINDRYIIVMAEREEDIVIMMEATWGSLLCEKVIITGAI